jgi:hypothetical protein
MTKSTEELHSEQTPSGYVLDDARQIARNYCGTEAGYATQARTVL